MQAFVEVICDHAGIIRAGPECDSYGQPFELAVAYRVDGSQAVIKGLVAGRRLRVSHYRAMKRALAERGLKPVWERIKRPKQN